MSMKITPSEHKVTFDNIDGAIASGKTIADITEIAMDKQFIDRSRHDWCWLSGKNTPPETGWYEVDRHHEQLTKIADATASELEWHERLFIYASALHAAETNGVLALYIGDEYEDRRLSALYLCGSDVLARVAQR
jgi:hypothetical protein